MKKKKSFVKTKGVAVVVAMFLAATVTVNAGIQEEDEETQCIEEETDSSFFVGWTEEPMSEDEHTKYCGMTESLNGELFAYSVLTVHTKIPRAEPGQPQGSQGIYMDVFLEELRSDHPGYVIWPYLVYYVRNGPFDWERMVAYSPVAIPVPPGYTCSRMHLGTLYLLKITHEDLLVPFRTGTAIYHGSEETNGTESSLGFWYMDVSPYNDSYDFIVLSKTAVEEESVLEL